MNTRRTQRSEKSVAILVHTQNVRGFFVGTLKVIDALVLIATVGIGGMYLYFNHRSQQETQARHLHEQQLQDKTYAAIERGRSAKEKRVWRYYYAEDPLSGQKKATSALLDSEDGLCTLQIDRHMDGSRSTWLTCEGMPAWGKSYSSELELETKFDMEEVSSRIKVKTEGKAIGEYPYQYDTVLLDSCTPDRQYPSRCDASQKFLSKLTTMKKVGFRSAMTDKAGRDYWAVFALAGSEAALVKIGVIARQAEVMPEYPNAVSAPESVQEERKEQSIHVVFPGERVGNFVLGMTKEQVIKIGKPHFKYNLDATVQTWVYINRANGNMLGATFADNSLLAVCFTSNKFDTEEGITTDNFDKPHMRLVANYPTTQSPIGTLDRQSRLSLLVARYSHVSGGLFYTIDTDGQRKGCINK